MRLPDRLEPWIAGGGIAGNEKNATAARQEPFGPFRRPNGFGESVHL